VEYLVKILDNQKELLRRTADRVSPIPSAEIPVSIPIETVADYDELINWMNQPLNQQSLVRWHILPLLVCLQYCLLK